MNYKDHILIIPNFVPNEFCDDIIKIFEESNAIESKIENVKQRKDISFRGYNMIADYSQKNNDKEVAKLMYYFQAELKRGLDIYAEHDTHIKESMNKGTWFYDGFKWQKTPVGGGYHVWHCENTIIWQRQLVWTLYLNDIEEGGETEFLNQKRRIQPKKGTMCIFPANWTHTHRGNPPLDKEKYIGTGWYAYHISEESWYFAKKNLAVA
tara:strand:- start:76 stop:702 length:627 start_codon:yes stop_codon:yes gene_type:complete